MRTGMERSNPNCPAKTSSSCPRFWAFVFDLRGNVESIDLMLIAAVVMLGLVAGFGVVRDGVISEFSDVSGSMQDFNQQFSFRGVSIGSATTTGSHYSDSLDFCDSPEDSPGAADNCIVFDLSPFNETQPGVNILLNPGFEQLDPSEAVRRFRSGSPTGYQFNEDDIPGWQTTATDGLIEVWESGFLGVDSQSGDYFVELNATQASQIYREIDVFPGTTFMWSIWHRGRSGVDVADVLIGPSGMQTVQATMSTGTAGWVNYTGTYTAPTGVTTVRIGFEAVSTSGGNPSSGNLLDILEIFYQ